MALLQTTSRFHASMEILNGPSRLVLVHRLPSLLAALHRQSTQQDPFQSFHLLALGLPTSLRAMFLAGHRLALGLLLAGGLGLPHAHHPELERLPSRIGTVLGGEQVHACPTELHLGRSRS